jgi:acetylglutamate kinase
VDEAIRKADVLVEALAWIRRFRGRHVVVKIGGSTLDDTEAIRALLTDIVFLETVGTRPIIVHGGGKAISSAMADAGIEPRFVRGRRYTDEATLDICARVLAGEITESLVAEIKSRGAGAVGLSYRTWNVLRGSRLELPDENGEPLDLGWVGQVDAIDLDALDLVCGSGRIPVIPSIALDADGHRLNVNADTAAAAVARLLKAEKLVFLSDVPGIYLDKDDPATRISHLGTARCRELIAEGVIAAGMVPKVEAAIEALEAGVGKVHVVDAALPHSLLLEIYSNTGIGTEIVK